MVGMQGPPLLSHGPQGGVCAAGPSPMVLRVVYVLHVGTTHTGGGGVYAQRLSYLRGGEACMRRGCPTLGGEAPLCAEGYTP